MTSTKEQYRYRILKTYSIIVDFEGEPPLKKVPSAVKGETFKQWRLRVLGDQVANVTVHGPWVPTPQMRMSTIQEWSKDAPFKKTLKALESDNKQAIKEALKEAVKETEAVKQSYASFPKETLEDLIAELEDRADPAVREFFQQFLGATSSEIDTEELLRRLIQRFNNNARSLREAEANS